MRSFKYFEFRFLFDAAFSPFVSNTVFKPWSKIVIICVFTLILNMLRPFLLLTSKNIELMKQIQLYILRKALNDNAKFDPSVERSSRVVVVTLCGRVWGPDWWSLCVIGLFWTEGGIHWGMCWSSFRGEWLGITWTWPKLWERGSTMRSISPEQWPIHWGITWRSEINTSSGGRHRGEPMAEGMSFVFGGSGPLHQGTSRCFLFRRAGGPALCFMCPCPDPHSSCASVSEGIVELPFVLLLFSWRLESVLSRVWGPSSWMWFRSPWAQIYSRTIKRRKYESVWC